MVAWFKYSILSGVNLTNIVWASSIELSVNSIAKNGDIYILKGDENSVPITGLSFVNKFS